jgi:hypothetical protein
VECVLRIGFREVPRGSGRKNQDGQEANYDGEGQDIAVDREREGVGFEIRGRGKE